MRLEEGIVALREQSLEWDSARAERVLAGAMARRERASHRSQLVRRSLLMVASSAAVVLVLLRGGAAPAGERELPSSAEWSRENATTRITPALAAVVAVDGATDAGYSRD
jgi:hypothetical protein